jgi:hypothetical protein
MSVTSRDHPLPPIGGTKAGSLGSLLELASPSSSSYAGASQQPPQPLDDPSGAPFATPTTGKLNNVEAQRIMAMVVEVQRKVQILGLLPDTIDRKTSSLFSGEAMSLIKVR